MNEDSQFNDLDVLMILPPQWTPLSPYYALPILAGELKRAGYSCIIKDLNIDFFHRILSPEFLTWCRVAVNNRHEKLGEEFINSIADEGVNAFSGASDLYHEIESKIEKYELYWDTVINNINKAKNILQTEEVYDPQKMAWAFNIITKGLDIASLPYFPSKIMLRDFKNRNHKMTLESVIEATSNKDENPFIDYYELVFSSISDLNPKMIGISINAFSQVVSGLTLAKLLKENLKNTHITIGGNFFTRVINTLKNKPEFFEHFCHSLTYEEGEIPIIKLIESIKTKQDLSQIPNLLYLKDKKVVINEKCQSKKLDDIADPDLTGIDLNAYLSPEIVLPIQASRGCYWKKCTFCDHDFGVNYNIKSCEKLISEMKVLNEKYGIKHFEFIDEAISPSYLRKMSQAILDNNLDIRWFIYARTEKGFTKELLDLAYKAGCRMTMWGVESGSRRIMDLINKGIDIDNRFEPLKLANDSGIWNFCFLFFGFPTETSEEAMTTINMIIDNKEIINSYGLSNFSLGKHTKMREEPEKFSIANIREDEEDLSTRLHYDVLEGMTPSQVLKVSELCSAICERIYFAPLWFSIGFREFLHLYLDKFGFEYVKQYSYLDPEKADKHREQTTSEQ
ncbi:MAG: hypothetical protein A2104_06505 [Candidatus Melainabacteria bacterium GWF2_32_7]|nr:MAG: hypothetical protein A2104_06505 [Candidatus Melainabacteria bacterium GWF2_32_7]